jgi:hypothetical protein
MEHPEVMPVATRITDLLWHPRMSVRTSFDVTPHTAVPRVVGSVAPAAEVVYLIAPISQAERIQDFSFIMRYVVKYMAPIGPTWPTRSMRVFVEATDINVCSFAHDNILEG